MSTNLRTCYISGLPNELILAIFKLLTCISYEIKPMDMVSWDYESDSVVRTRVEYRRQCQLKHLTLKLVCKSWYSLLVPSLYDWIKLRYYKRLTHLRSAICNPPKWGHRTETLGWHTKRLDLEFEDDRPDPQSANGEELNALIDIIRALPNLEVFTNRTRGMSSIPGIHPKVLEEISPNLKVFSGHGYICHVETENWHSFLVSHPNLVAVNPPLVGRPPHDLTRGIPSTRLEHYCAYGSLCNERGVAWVGPCPSLKRLSIQINTLNMRDDMVRSFMQYTSSLTTLQLSVGAPLWIPVQVRELQPVWMASPNLTRLDVILKRGAYRLDTDRSPPGLPAKITTFGVRFIHSMAVEDQMRSWHVWFLSELVRWNSPTPTTIQFLDGHTMDQFLLGSGDIVKQGKVTSWLEPDGALLDLESVEDLEELASQARERIKNRKR